MCILMGSTQFHKREIHISTIDLAYIHRYDDAMSEDISPIEEIIQDSPASRGHEADYFFPIIPEETQRVRFSFLEWEGYAVSEDEFQIIQKLLNNETARKAYAERYEKGKAIRTDDDSIVTDKLEADTLAVRCDGVLFFLNSIQAGALQTSDDPQVQTRQKGEGRGVFMTHWLTSLSIVMATLSN